MGRYTNSFQTKRKIVLRHCLSSSCKKSRGRQRKQKQKQNITATSLSRYTLFSFPRRESLFPNHVLPSNKTKRTLYTRKQYRESGRGHWGRVQLSVGYIFIGVCVRACVLVCLCVCLSIFVTLSFSLRSFLFVQHSRTYARPTSKVESYPTRKSIAFLPSLTRLNVYSCILLMTFFLI